MISLVLLAALAANPNITLEHHGSLRDCLQEIARAGGLNLVVTGGLHEEAAIHLKDVSAEEALATVATAYNLELIHKGNLWIIKPLAGAVVAPPMPAVPPVEPRPPPPPNGQKSVDEAVDDAEAQTEAALAHAEAMREEAEAARDRAEGLRDAKREEQEAAREEARARIEEAKAHKKGDENGVVNMNGPVVVKENQRTESAISYGGSVTIEKNARVDGDVVSFGGDVILQDNARVDGDAVSFGGKVIKGENAKVKGEEVSFGGAGLGSVMASKALQVSRPNSEAKGEGNGGAGVAGFFAQFAVLFGLGFLLMMFVPQRMKSIEAEMQQAPGKNGAAGFLALLCSLPLTVFLCITLIGIPVALAFWMIAFVCGLMGLVAVANILGSRVPVPRLRRTQALALAVGLLGMLLVARIPVLGPLLMSIGVFISLGAIIRTRIGQRGQGMPIETAFIDHQPA